MLAVDTDKQPSATAAPCPGCGSPLYLTTELAGRTIRCRGCGVLLAPVAALDSLALTPCPGCQHPLYLTSRLAGCRVRCRSCQGELAVVAIGGPGDSCADEEARPTSAAAEPCPHCGNLLRLVPELAGHLIRCRACQTVLAVEAHDWTLAVEECPDANAAPKTAVPAGRAYEPPAPVRTELEGPREPPRLPAEQAATKPEHEPENLNEPEVLSDQDASGFLEELDAAEAAQRRRRGPDELRLTPRAPNAAGSPSADLDANPVRPSGNGKAARPEHAANDAPNGRRARRLTRDASDAAARILSPKAFAAKLRLSRPSPGSPPAQPAWPTEPAWPAPAQPQAGEAFPEIELEPEPTPSFKPDAGLEPEPDVKPEPKLKPEDFKPEPDSVPEPRPKPKSAAESFAAYFPKPPAQLPAQPAPTGGRGGRRVIAIVALLVTLAGAGWGSWAFFYRPVHPQSRYLPDDCAWFVSTRWSDLPQTTLGTAAKELPGLTLIERVRTFLKCARVNSRDVECVNAGGSAEGTKLVVVYRLSRPIDPREIADQPAFRDLRKRDGPTEKVRGTPVYSLGATVLAFPTPQVIVSGPTEAVREVLRGRDGFGEPLNGLLNGVDFSAACALVSTGLPAELLSTYLPQNRDLADDVIGTTGTCQYGPTVKLARTIHLRSPQRAAELQTALQRALERAARNSTSPTNVRQLLADVQVAAVDATVRIELSIPAEAIDAESRKVLKVLFG